MKSITDIKNLNNSAEYAYQKFDFGLAGIYTVNQVFNDANTSNDILTMYKNWGFTGHNGIDLFSCNEQEAVRSFCNGTVIFCDWYYNQQESSYFGGGIITIVQEDNSNRQWVYMHLDDNNMVTVGQKVKYGDTIGLMGGIGFYGTEFAQHTHVQVVEVINNQIQNFNNGFKGGIDPLPLIQANYLESIGKTQGNNNQDMNKQALIDTINNTTNYDQTTKDRLIAAVIGNDANYLLAFTGSAVRTDLATSNAINHQLRSERDSVQSELETLKKNSLELEQQLQDSIESLKAEKQVEQLSQNQNQNLKKISSFLESKTVRIFGSTLITGWTAGFTVYQANHSIKEALYAFALTIVAGISTMITSAIKDTLKLNIK